MTIHVVRYPVHLQLFCDEAGTASAAVDQYFVTAAVAMTTDSAERRAIFRAWMSDHGVDRAKGRRWARHRGAELWGELASFLLANDIWPLCAHSSIDAETEVLAKRKMEQRAAARAAMGLAPDAGVSARDVVWCVQMALNATIGPAIWATENAPVGKLTIQYDEFELGPVMADIVTARVKRLTGKSVRESMMSHPIADFDPRLVAGHDRLLERRLIWGHPSFTPVRSRDEWCRLADAIAAWRRAALLGDEVASSKWSDLESRFPHAGTNRPCLYLRLDLTEVVHRLMSDPWPIDRASAEHDPRPGEN